MYQNRRYDLLVDVSDCIGIKWIAVGGLCVTPEGTSMAYIGSPALCEEPLRFIRRNTKITIEAYNIQAALQAIRPYAEKESFNRFPNPDHKAVYYTTGNGCDIAKYYNPNGNNIYTATGMKDPIQDWMKRMFQIYPEKDYRTTGRMECINGEMAQAFLEHRMYCD